jgi:nitrate reductase gamma subunit
MSDLLNFTAHTLHTAALAAMGLIYAIRLIWLFKRFKAGRERQPKTGLPGTTKAKGVVYSWMVIAFPWSMESQRNNLLFWMSFVVFHIGVAAAITLSIFLIPYFPQVLTIEWLRIGLQVLMAASFVIGVIRILRRIVSKYMRAISTPDDYFSITILTVWFAFAFFAVPNDISGGEWHLITFFIMTSFLLVYVPFSKISHYLYYPFTRYWLGKSLGHRGVYPLRDGHSARANAN